jgi:general secretion pathway protein A
LSSLDFFNILAVEFKMNQQFDSKGAFLISFKNFLHKAYANHKKVLLIIDEAQRLGHELLEQIRLLSNIELLNRKLINIFFVGQTEFNEMLMENRNRAVWQRITVRYHIEPLSEPETRNYIIHRLKIAGSKREIFSKDAIQGVYSFSAGYPRLINIICDHALLTGYSSGSKVITRKVVDECEGDFKLRLDVGTENNKEKADIDRADAAPHNYRTVELPEKPSIVKRTSVIAAILMLLALGIYLFTSQKTGDTPRWTMEEIAPQKYKGQLPQDTDAIKVDDTTTSALVDGESIEDPPDRNQSVRKPIRVTENDKSADVETQKEVEDIKAETQLQSPVQPAEQQEIAVLKDLQPAPPPPDRKSIIYFKRNSNVLPDQSYELLNRIADFMLQNPATTIDIRGYTDSTGSFSYNEKVSEFRANSIKLFLVGTGVDPSKISARGLGPENPIATNATREGRSKNRRVELELNIQP